MPDPLDIRHLRYFLAVAEAGNFSRAADRLGISQPSVSQQMRDLEAGLRVPLFQRRGKRILLTPTITRRTSFGCYSGPKRAACAAPPWLFYGRSPCDQHYRRRNLIH